MSESKMEDRELLELAAKGAGLPMHRYCEPWGAMVRYTPQDGYHGPSWNPLTDDGDAFRLAVKLGIEIIPDAEIAETATAFMVGRVGYNTTESWGPLRDGSQDDPYAATRRAIVRAAAAIATQSPQQE